MLVRTWNVYHGNSSPPGRRGWLAEMVRLASQDEPDVLCLQELPVWACARLERWSSMRAFPAIARRPLVRGPGPRWVTRLHLGWIRSALVGQANAILVSREHEAEDLGHERISGRGRERRIVHAVRVDGLVVANVHVSNAAHARSVLEEEIARAREFVERRASPGETIVLAGDLNLPDVSLDGYSQPTSTLDHVLVAGAPSTPPVVWPVARRTVNGLVLSDHAPVEVAVG